MMKSAFNLRLISFKPHCCCVKSCNLADFISSESGYETTLVYKLFLFCLALILGLSVNNLEAALLQPGSTEPPAVDNKQPVTVTQPGVMQPGEVKQPESTEDAITKRLLAEGVAPELLVNKNLMTEKLKSEYTKEQVARYFRTAMNNGNLAGNDADVIKKFVKFQVYSMTVPEDRNKLRSYRLAITKTHIDGYSNASPAKDLYLREVCLRCKELLDNHLTVRIQATMTLVELNTDKGNLVKGTPPTPYTNHMDILLGILNDKTQHQAVKIQLVTGIERICSLGRSFGIPQTKDRYELTIGLLNELQPENKYHWWYKKNILRCLPEMTIIYDATSKKPIVTEMLIKFMRDKQEDKLVRAEAARSLGRIQLDSNHNIDVIVAEIVKFGLEMGIAYNQNLTDITYRDVLWSTYLAFHPENADEQKKQYGLLEQVNKVTLAGSKTVVENGYEQILVIINSVFNEYTPGPGKAGKPIDPNKLKAVSEWLKANPPKQSSIHAFSEPLK
jgi:hypothetical protein